MEDSARASWCRSEPLNADARETNSSTAAALNTRTEYERIALRPPVQDQLAIRRSIPGRGAVDQNGRMLRRRRVQQPKGRPLKLDPSTVSGKPGTPAFLSRPSGAPIYYGFPILEGTEVEGFRFGVITDFLASPDTAGDAFVVAPDDSRCGLVWESEVPDAYFKEIIPPVEGRWGVWAVGLPLPLATVEDSRRYLEALLPELRPRWESWSSTSTT